MKLRHGFVSNSSSSSFIIQINKDPETCPHCGRSGIDLVKFMEHHNHYETELDWTDVDEAIAEVEGEIAYSKQRDYDYEWETKKLAMLQKAKATGKTIIGIDVSYHDDALKMVIDDLVATGDITILQGD